MDEVRLLEVVAPAPNQDLVALADVRDELGAPRGQDARLRRYITAASSVIATHTRRVWRQETVTETFYRNYFSSTGGWSWHYHSLHHRASGKPIPLVLARYPVASVGAVVVVGADPNDPGAYQLDEPKGLLYNWDGENGVPMPWSVDTVAVTYTCGYALADVPPDVQQACMTMIRQRFFSSGRDPYLRSINVPGVQEESYWAGPDQSALPPESCGLLEKHIDMRM